MKEGWEYNSLGIVCKIYNGNSINADYKKNHYMGLSEGYPFIATKDVSFDGIINYNNGVRIPFKEGLKVAKPSSVFICVEGGSAGRKIGLVDREVCFGNKLFCLESKGFVLGSFIYYYLKSALFQEQFSERLTGLIGGVSAKKFNDISIIYPPLSEQQRIVDYLDAAFAKIDAMKANAEKSLNEAKALFQASLKEMLEPKEGWEEKTLKEVCTLITDGTHHSPPNYESGKYKYITAKNIKIWGLDLSNITYVSEDIHKEILARCNPQKGDVLYIKDGATTGIAIVNPLDEEFSMLSSVALLKPNKDVLSSDFLCFTLNSPSIYNQTRNQMDGAAITRVTLVKIKGFVVPIPPLSEQQSIVATLDSLKSKVDRLQANSEKISQECDALKQSILRQFFE